MDVATFIGGAFMLFVAAKFLPAMIEGWQQGTQQRKMHEAIKEHPQHASEIRRAMQPPPPSWEVQKKSGAGKWIVIALCIGYIALPLDLIPDFIPILGWGDDLAAGLIGLRALMK
jgi:uncharacterized membrane protein YkvA (DUF1232 family)